MGAWQLTNDCASRRGGLDGDVRLRRPGALRVYRIAAALDCGDVVQCSDINYLAADNLAGSRGLLELYL